MRKRRAEKRPVVLDPIYNDYVVAKFVNNIMFEGRKNVARTIIYDAFDIVKEKTNEDPVEVFKKAISNVAPLVEVRSRRVGGATYQVPVDVREERRLALAIRWIKNYAKARRDKKMSQRLAAEFMAASKGEGSAVKKREDTHKMAEANKAFAHFKW
ncbi:MAG: 30S ribosomal protein S7 [Candidatus Kapabacteria bacterium]|jgi:small subunit ribosomal protein S7|nr:30S ribosomal protein S7 [Ignavibacteriota bacterium]MCW5884016.1 30S ribosomal protein S7 [Candidatus Kapabacteria bacterium]